MPDQWRPGPNFDWRRWGPWVGGLALITVLAVAGYVVWLARLAPERPIPPQPSYLTSDILVLGDSQLSFGAGPVLSNFFSNLGQQCQNDVWPTGVRSTLNDLRFAMIGTRSTSLQSWVTTKTRAWELLCHKDRKWGVNASAWGTVKPKERRYVQIGEGEAFQFCAPSRPPLQNLFDVGYAPKLLMIFVGGNGAGRLARDRGAAEADVNRFMELLPQDTGCIFMMTAPIYSRAHNATRVIAQRHLNAAFAAHGKRCTFVEGHTSATRAAIEGQAQYFKRDASGKVRDPYHANEVAAARFLELRRGALCRALTSQLKQPVANNR